MPNPAAVLSSVSEVPGEWFDGDAPLPRHLYSVLLDRAGDEAFELFGLGPHYASSRALTYYTAEAHLTYLRPLRKGDRYYVAFQILDHDDKRLRTFQQLVHVDGWLSVVAETLSLHVDMAGPKVVPFPPDIRARIADMAAAQRGLPVPNLAGRSIDLAGTTPGHRR